MSHENVEVVRQAVEAFNREDAHAFVALASPDVEWEDAIFWSGVPGPIGGEKSSGSGSTRSWNPGKASMSKSRRSLKSQMMGCSIACSSPDAARAAAWNAELRVWAVNWFADGKVSRRRVFRERAEALEAAGLTGVGTV